MKDRLILAASAPVYKAAGAGVVVLALFLYFYSGAIASVKLWLFSLIP